VKTRLAADLGVQKAAEIYSKMAHGIVRNLVHSKEWETLIFFYPPDREREIESWLGGGCQLFAQEGESLGDRMANAFTKSFLLGADKAVVIGTDRPQITVDIVSQSFSLLDAAYIVMGPTEDGGYYLMGIKEMWMEIFKDISWGTDMVFTQTLNKITSLGVGCLLLETLRDVDTVADLDLAMLAGIRVEGNP
jgi:rSAM/selenodomain-associated transferase 1